MRTRWLAVSLMLLALAVVADGGDDKPAPPKAKPTAAAVRDAFKSAADLQSSGAEHKVCEAAINAFLDAFLASDWTAFDAAADRVILNRGLYLGAERVVDKDPGLAAKAYEKFIAMFPDDSVAPQSRRALAAAWIASGDAAKGLDRLEKNVAAANSRSRSSENVALGDWRCALGDLPGAVKAWTAAVAAVDWDPGTERAAQARAIPESRIALVGQPFPALGPLKRVSGDPKQDPVAPGRIVVVELWETAVGPSRAINELAGPYGGSDVMFVSLTRFNAEGPFGHAGTGGRSEQVNLTAGNVEAFAKRIAAEEKLRSSVFVATDQAFSKLGGDGVVVVDRASRVALRSRVGPSPGEGLLVKVAIDKLRASPK